MKAAAPNTRSRPWRAGLGLVTSLAVAACSDATSQTSSDDVPPDSGPRLKLTLITGDVSNPVELLAPADDPRLFVVEQAGRIRIIRNGRLMAQPFLDIGDRVVSGGERGLLGLAFHPDYAANGFFYVNYTGAGGATRVERYSVSGDPDVADPTSAHLLLQVAQPFSNHNGGQVFFGNDGKLFIALGDGGAGGDPLGSGQDRTTLLGSLLRVDVDVGDPYAIPEDNPFVASATFRREIWAWGLRNPWRSAVDATTGFLYVADVGQNRVEEISVVQAASGGLNFGWNILEGSECFSSPMCDSAGTVLPLLEYDHSDGCSVTGGKVYRGGALPDLVGHYLYADFCEGWVRSFRFDGTAAVDRTEWFSDVGSIAAFGVDAAGELYLLTRSGRVIRIDPS